MARHGKYGKYCKYVSNSKLRVPKSTVYFKKKNFQEYHIENHIHNNLILAPSIDFPTNINEPNNQLELSNDYVNVYSHTYNDFDENEYDYNNDNEKLFDDIVNVTENLSKESTCALLLSVFFNCRMTQRCMNLVIKTMNLIQRIELPKTFDGLAKVLLKIDNDHLQYKKRYYCSQCKILVSELPNRFQRTCSGCETR